MTFDVLDWISPSSAVLLSVLLALGIAAFLSWFVSTARLPGPWGLPILGYYPLLRENFQPQLHELAKKHGEVYIINLAGQNFLYLGTLRALREAHVNKAEYFPNRSTKPSVLYDPLDKSLTFLEGEHWRVQRKFFVQSMREVGLARNKEELKGPIENAIESTLEIFKSSGDDLVDIMPLMTKQCTDVIRRLVLGDDISDADCAKLNETYLKILLPMSDKNMLLIGYLARFFYLSRNQGYKEMLIAKDEITVLLHKIVDDHRASFDPNQQPRDLIDLYLHERWIRDKKNDPIGKYFTDPILVASLIQAYGDGSVTIGIFIGMYLRELSLQPKLQDELYDEIIQAVGKERFPNWNDRPALPLLDSVMKEILRTVKLASIFPGLECATETTVLGVRVPKGCVTLMNMWAIHHDPLVYENPDQFDPYRFMPDKPKVELPISFGVGRRACAGEGLVMAEMMMFLSAILQNFSLFPEDDKENYTLDELMQSKIRFVPRPGGRYST